MASFDSACCSVIGLHAKENAESEGWKESNSLEVHLTVAV
jgi:hypothetical protein